MMKQKFAIIAALALVAHFSSGQVIDRYGINIGASYSTQIWDYKSVPIDLDTEYKAGLMAFIQAEKDLGNIFSLRTELGYIQKGFRHEFQWMSEDGTFIEMDNNNVVLYDLALNLGLKVKPYEFDFSPYLFIGFRGDYLISYKDIVIEEPESGLKLNMFESAIEEFNKFNIGGLLGVGLEIKELFYFELEFNPNLTKNFDGDFLTIKDNCWGAKLGLNINKLIKP
jgi:hypothetical protein